MKFNASNEPVYTLLLAKATQTEIKEIDDWLLSNLTGQVIVVNENYDGTIKTLTRPAHDHDYFGGQNPFSDSYTPYQTMFLFTEESDLTAFLIKFDSSNNS